MKKVALFAFNGDSMCFIHVLLNALDLKVLQMQENAQECYSDDGCSCPDCILRGHMKTITQLKQPLTMELKPTEPEELIYELDLELDSRENLKKAILFREILGKPIGLRDM